jgi:hypothetical protein
VWMVLFAILLFAAGLAFLLDVRSRSRFDALVAEIEAMGGTVVVLGDDDDAVERWFLLLCGRDPQMERISGVSLKNCDVPDEWLKNCRRMRELNWLVLSGTPVTDAGIAHIAGMARIETSVPRRWIIPDSNALLWE